jgi:hypothetical protein
LRHLLLLSILALFFMVGALGLRTVADCDSDPSIILPAEKMGCYQAAAVTMAYAGQPTEARGICQMIWDNFGGNIPADSGNDQRRKAELVSNSCFFDVARIAKDPTACGYITEHDNIGSNLFGSNVSYDTCYDEVNRLIQISPENYYQPGRDNICVVSFIFPLLALGALRKRN